MNCIAVPFFRFSHDPDALARIEECLQTGWLTTGPRTREFERLFAAELAAELAADDSLHAVALNSCTAALHLALEAIGLQRGEIVLVPTMTFAATAEVVRYFDATPVFIDTEPDTLNISVEHLKATLDDLDADRPLPGHGVLQGRVRAVIPVHYGGQPCDLEGVSAIADHHDMSVIEDAAHAFPAGWMTADGGRRMVGAATSRVTCFSFYANKTITTGEGGMAVTADAALSERIRLMSLHGMNRDAWRRFEASGTWDYQLVAPGFKYNMTDIAASIGVSQLARAEEFRCARQRISERYDQAFAGVDAVEPLVRRDGIVHAHHLYVVKLRLELLRIDRAQFIELMKERGIVCSVHWRPLHMHPYYVETYGYRAEDFPQAAAVWPRIVSLPLFPSMTDAEVEHVIGSVLDILRTHEA